MAAVNLQSLKLTNILVLKNIAQQLGTVLAALNIV
jgi:hypothetical protein